MEIKTDDYPTLSQVATSVLHGEDVSDVLEDMWDLLNEAGGYGLAANQVGLLSRIILIKTPRFTGEIINPVLTEGRFEKSSDEGCLSVPGERYIITRFNRIVLTGYDRDWNPVRVYLKALSAFCAQHEVDHLDGITIVNKRQ